MGADETLRPAQEALSHYRVGFDVAGVIAARSEEDAREVVKQFLTDHLVDCSPIKFRYVERED